jgi:hypothetical protein
MRLPFLTLTAIATVFVATPASAQRYDPRYPVCMHVYTGGPTGGGSDWFDCSFMSLEQCRATASGLAARHRRAGTTGETVRPGRSPVRVIDPPLRAIPS